LIRVESPHDWHRNPTCVVVVAAAAAAALSPDGGDADELDEDAGAAAAASTVSMSSKCRHATRSPGTSRVAKSRDGLLLRAGSSMSGYRRSVGGGSGGSCLGASPARGGLPRCGCGCAILPGGGWCKGGCG
jgi:hypothetical protein